MFQNGATLLRMHGRIQFSGYKSKNDLEATTWADLQNINKIKYGGRATLYIP